MTSLAAIAAKVPKPVGLAEAEQRIVALRDEGRALSQLLAEAAAERDAGRRQYRVPTRERQQELDQSCAEAHARMNKIRLESLEVSRAIERCRPAYAEAVSRALRDRRRKAAHRAIAALEQWREASTELEDVVAQIRLAGGNVKAVFGPMFVETAISEAREIVAECDRCAPLEPVR